MIYNYLTNNTIASSLVVEVIITKTSCKFGNRKICTINGPLNTHENTKGFKSLHYYIHIIPKWLKDEPLETNVESYDDLFLNKQNC
jgi:hypothetical protein